MENKLNSKNPNCWYKEVCTNECSPICRRYLEMSYLMENSGLPKAKQKPIALYPPDEDYEAFTVLSKYKANIVGHVTNGDNLYIMGEHTGNGKTSWAIKLLLKYFDEVWDGNAFKVRGLFVHVPTLLLSLKDFNNPLPKSYKANLINADLVIWDDIASSGISTYDYTQLLTYIDGRLLEEKSNIFTGNITTKEHMKKVLYDKLTSRVWECSKRIEIKGKDYRGEENN